MRGTNKPRCPNCDRLGGVYHRSRSNSYRCQRCGCTWYQCRSCGGTFQDGHHASGISGLFEALFGLVRCPHCEAVKY